MYGGRSSVWFRASGCGPEGREFDSRRSPKKDPHMIDIHTTIAVLRRLDSRRSNKGEDKRKRSQRGPPSTAEERGCQDVYQDTRKTFDKKSRDTIMPGGQGPIESPKLDSGAQYLDPVPPHE